MGRELRDIKYERKRLLEALDKTPKDSEKYKNIVNNLKTMAEVEDTLRGDTDWKDWTDLLIKLLALGVSVGQICAMVYLGRLSYAQEQSMAIKNGSVWSTAMRMFMNKPDKV